MSGLNAIELDLPHILPQPGKGVWMGEGPTQRKTALREWSPLPPISSETGEDPGIGVRSHSWLKAKAAAGLGTFQPILSSFLCFGKRNACFQGWSAFYRLREPGQQTVSSVWILSAHLYYRDFIITFWSDLMKTQGFRNTGQSLIPKGLSRCSLFSETPSYTPLSEASRQYFPQPALWLTGKQVQLSNL